MEYGGKKRVSIEKVTAPLTVVKVKVNHGDG